MDGGTVDGGASSAGARARLRAGGVRRGAAVRDAARPVSRRSRAATTRSTATSSARPAARGWRRPRLGPSRRERVIMSTVYGGGAALLGSLVWYAVARITGMELGIIAIGIGLLVGVAVKKGSRARGGRGYQALAMALTYSLDRRQLRSGGAERPRGEAAPTRRVQSEGKPPKTSAEDAGEGRRPPARPRRRQAREAAHEPVARAGRSSPASCSASPSRPVPAGASNFMGWIIIAIALYEAWKINRRAPMTILGPFQLAPAPARAAARDLGRPARDRRRSRAPPPAPARCGGCGADLGPGLLACARLRAPRARLGDRRRWSPKAEAAEADRPARRRRSPPGAPRASCCRRPPPSTPS